MREEEGKSRRFFSSGNEKRKREQYSTRSKPLQPFHFVPPATPLPRFRFTSQLGSILTRWRARFIGEQFQFRPEARNGQRSAFLLPPPLPIVEGRGEVWVLLNGRSNHLAPTVCSSRAFLLAFRFSESIHGYQFAPLFTDWLATSLFGGQRVEGGIEIYRNSFVTPFVSSPHVGRKHCRGALLAIRAPKRESQKKFLRIFLLFSRFSFPLFLIRYVYCACFFFFL